MLKREIVFTADGSHTVRVPELNVAYHSHHGSLQESLHVFIEAGLREAFRTVSGPVRVFEMGFGTGLNALLTALEAEKEGRKVVYTAIERYPLSEEEGRALNYGQLLPGGADLLQALHQCPWNVEVPLTDCFLLKKEAAGLLDFPAGASFHVIYFDAFAPDVQPELWTEAVFAKMLSLLAPGGMLVTYCSRSVVRRAMKAAGLAVKKLPGPWGKREMVRASRLPASPPSPSTGGGCR